MAEVPKQIGELVAKFDQNLDAYHTAAPAFTILLKQIAVSFV